MIKNNSVLLLILFSFGLLFWSSSPACAAGEEPLPAGVVPFSVSIGLSEKDLNQENDLKETKAVLLDEKGDIVLETLGFHSDRDGHICVLYQITNHSDYALTRVRFDLNYLDENGAVIDGRSIHNAEWFQDAPIFPGETRTFEHTNYFTGVEKTKALEFVGLWVFDERILPAWTDPKPGNLLLDFCNDEAFSRQFEDAKTNPPISMDYHVDEDYDGTITDPAAIQAVLEALQEMRIGDETEIFVTDSGIWYSFNLEDGTSWSVGFDSEDMFYWHGKPYAVINRDKLNEVMEWIELP